MDKKIGRCSNIYREYYNEINNLSDLLGKYVNSYRLLIAAANELNNIALAKKDDVKDSVKRVNELGDVIDILLDAIQVSEKEYLPYIKLKGKWIGDNINKDNILTEIEGDLYLKNSERDDE